MIQLSRLDFPTFERPAKATCRRPAGPELAREGWWGLWGVGVQYLGWARRGREDVGRGRQGARVRPFAAAGGEALGHCAHRQPPSKKFAVRCPAWGPAGKTLTGKTLAGVGGAWGQVGAVGAGYGARQRRQRRSDLGRDGNP